KGRTAIDLLSMGGAEECGPVFSEIADGFGLMIWKIIRPAANTASIMVIPTIFRPVRRVIDWLGAISDSSLIPSDVSSKAHDRMRTAGKPGMMTTMRNFITQEGESKAGRKIDAAWRSSHATTT